MFSVVVCAFLLCALMDDCHDIRTVQELLGHNDVNTTMIYAQVLNRGGKGVCSPLDGLRSSSEKSLVRICVSPLDRSQRFLYFPDI